MDRPFIFKALLTVIFILSLLPIVQAGVPIKRVFLADTNTHQLQDEKKDKPQEKPDKKETPDNKQDPNKPDIREVPKARKQSRPPTVVKPNIKVKPIKVIRPKIKKP